MAARVRGQPAVPTEESPAQFKYRILTALGKLDDRDAQGRATDELKQVIDELTAEQLSTLVGCIHDAIAKAGSTQAKREHVRLFAVLCSVHGDHMAPFLSKIIAVLAKMLKTVDVCIDALALMSKSVPSAAFHRPSSEDTPFPLSLFILPLFKLVADHTKPSQIGGAQALSRVLEANHRLVPVLLHHVMPHLLRWLSLPHFLASAQLLVAVHHCIMGAKQEFLEYVPALMELLLPAARSVQWTSRKAAFDTLRVLAQCLGAAMNSYRDDVLRLLNELRYDKIRAVRESVGGAQQYFHELGASVSPTKVPLQPEDRPIRAHPSHPPTPTGRTRNAAPFPSASSLHRSPATTRKARIAASSLYSTSPTAAAALPVHVVPASPLQTSVALAELARTVQAIGAQQTAFMNEVHGRLEDLDRRVRGIESRIGAPPSSGGNGVTSASRAENEEFPHNEGEGEGEEALVARIAQLEREEEAYGDGNGHTDA